MGRFYKYFLFMIAIAVTSCSDNILKEFGNKDTDEALFYSATQNVDSGDYTAALADIARMSTTYAATRDVLYLQASAYAGRCGYNQMTALDNLSGISGNLMFYMMQQYGGATASQVTDCIAAEDALQSIGVAADRTNKENMFMAMLSLAKMGTILAFNADTNDDNVLDGGFDACAGGSISDLHAQHVGISFAEFILSFTAVGSAIGGGSLTVLNQACTDLGTLGAQYNICDDLNPSDYDADETLATRTIIHEGDALGLGSCGAGTPNVANCLCP